MRRCRHCRRPAGDAGEICNRDGLVGPHSFVDEVDPHEMSDYDRGVVEGLQRYAVWKDGTEYVGSAGTTLRQAIVRHFDETGRAIDETKVGEYRAAAVR